MNNMVGVNELMQPIINQGEIIISAFNNPVSRRIGCKIDTVISIGSGLTF